MNCDRSRKRNMLVEIQLSMSHRGMPIAEIRELTSNWMRKRLEEMEAAWQDEKRLREIYDAQKVIAEAAADKVQAYQKEQEAHLAKIENQVTAIYDKHHPKI